MTASAPIANDGVDIAEDQNVTDTFFEDDSDLPCHAIVANMLGSNSASVAMTANGDLASTAMAESLGEGEGAGAGTSQAEGSESVFDSSDVGRGKRRKTQNRMYSSFWRHNDEDPSDAEDEN